MTLPLIVILALAIGAVTGSGNPSPSRSGPPGDLSYSAPPFADALAAPCAKVLAKLPVTLTRLDPRVVHTTPETPYVVAWGDPAIVLRCGVRRPEDLAAGSGALFVDGGVVTGPFYDVIKDGDANVWTTVDREPYISITVPRKYNSGPLPALSKAIATAVPAVCSTVNTQPVDTLCTRRR